MVSRIFFFFDLVLLILVIFGLNRTRTRLECVLGCLNYMNFDFSARSTRSERVSELVILWTGFSFHLLFDVSAGSGLGEARSDEGVKSVSNRIQNKGWCLIIDGRGHGKVLGLGGEVLHVWRLNQK